MTSWPCTQKISPRLRSKFDLRRDAHEQSIQPQPFDFPFEERQLVLQGTGMESDSDLYILSGFISNVFHLNLWSWYLILLYLLALDLGNSSWWLIIDDVWLYSTWPTWLMPPICPWNTPGSYATVAGNVLPWVRCVSWTSLARTGGGESCWVPSAALSIFVGFRWLSGYVYHQRRPHINLA